MSWLKYSPIAFAIKGYLWFLISTVQILQASAFIPPNPIAPISQGGQFWVAEDTTGDLTLNHIKQLSNWKRWEGSILNFGMTQSTWWVKFAINNVAPNHYLRLQAPLIDYIDVYFVNNRGIDHRQSGAAYPFSQREISALNYLFKIPQGQSTVYIRLLSNFALQVPIDMANLSALNKESANEYWLLGLYFGLMLTMIFYNLFVYTSVRDKVYLFYILYIISVTVLYASFQGITFQYLWPNTPNINTLVPTFAAMAAIFITLFGWYFIGINKKRFVKTHKLFLLLIVIFIACGIANLLGEYYINANISQLLTMVISFSLLFICAVVYGRGGKNVRFFLLAWSLYLTSVIIYILQLQAVIDYNNFTNNSVLYGSAIGVLLLSFALADRINWFKKEKEASQQQALQAFEENERIVREQNIYLESRVTDRTKKLNQSNQTLQQTLVELKQTQSKMVESEKMMSLGQLTAGIAHEINNPLTFIKANIHPLKRDVLALNELIRLHENTTYDQWQTNKKSIEAFKQTIDYDQLQAEVGLLLSGIEEGANRTVKIVESLKSFSRLNNNDFRDYRLADGIESTLTLLSHKIQEHTISITKDYQKDVVVSCMPDRINQVLMNILSNAIDALKDKEGEHTINIAIKAKNKWVTIEIADNGVGIEKTIINKLCDPFFTTKPVGSGTGLGLSITYGIIKEHKGEIHIDSILGEKTVVTVKLPTT